MLRKKIKDNTKAPKQEPAISLTGPGTFTGRNGGGAVIQVKANVMTAKYNSSKIMNVTAPPLPAVFITARMMFPREANKKVSQAIL